MKKVLVVLIIILALTVSCENVLMKDLMSDPYELKLTCVSNSNLYLASYTGTTPTDVYDCVLLTFDYDESITLIQDCLGSFAGYAEKIIIPECVTKVRKNAFRDSCLKEIEILSSATDISSNAYSNCSNLKKVTQNGTVIFPTT